MPNPVVETKPWYTSKTLWGIVIAGVALVLGWLGKPDAAANLGAEQAEITSIIDRLVVLVGLAIAAYGRVVAKSKITP